MVSEEGRGREEGAEGECKLRGEEEGGSDFWHGEKKVWGGLLTEGVQAGGNKEG